MGYMSPNNFYGLMTSTYCSECKVRTRLDHLSIVENNDNIYFAITACIDCEKVVIFQYKKKEDAVTESPPIPNPILKIDVELIYSYPHSSETRIEYVPQNIAESYIEGIRCLDANAPNGSVSMFRRTLQQICVYYGANHTDNLVEQIKKLPKEVGDTATEIRKWGNLGSHEDNNGIISSVSNEDAESIKRFLESLFLILYQHPAEIKKLKSKRM